MKTKGRDKEASIIRNANLACAAGRLLLGEITTWQEFLEPDGPIQKRWNNFSPLGKEKYHCHLTYSYVACWTCQKGEIEIEVYYVGSREKAPY